MTSTIKRAGRALFCLAIAGALGSGAAQAFAAQPASGGTGEARYCAQPSCSIKCGYQGAVSGFCDRGVCVCIFET